MRNKEGIAVGGNILSTNSRIVAVASNNILYGKALFSNSSLFTIILTNFFIILIKAFQKMLQFVFVSECSLFESFLYQC